MRTVAAEGLGLNPNVDYYSAGLYHSLGIPSDAVWKDASDRPHLIYYGEPIRGLT